MFSTKPFKSILELSEAFPTDEACIKHLEALRWADGVISPFDPTSKVYTCKGNKYRCKNTGKYFNVLYGTVFENTKVPLRQWFMAIYLFCTHKKGISSYQLANDLNITQKTAWFLLQRIRYVTEHESFLRQLEGTVEVDETFVGGKNKNRHYDKKVKNSQGRSFKDKTPVFGAIERGGIVRAYVVPDTKRETIQPIVLGLIKRGSNIMSDEWSAYQGLNRLYNHGIVDHGRGQYVNGEATTNRMENFWSNFKRSLHIYHNCVSRRHLQLYVNESVFRFNFRSNRTDDRFNLLLQSVNGKRLTYKKLTEE